MRAQQARYQSPVAVHLPAGKGRYGLASGGCGDGRQRLHGVFGRAAPARGWRSRLGPLAQEFSKPAGEREEEAASSALANVSSRLAPISPSGAE